MRLWVVLWLVGALAALTGLTGPLRASETLSVCLPRNAGVIAGRRMTGGSGFDYHMAQAVADKMGRRLEVVWFENELEEERDALSETYAMLSHGLCDVVPGHPRYAGAVGAPAFKRAALPRWLGMPQAIDPDTGFLKDQLAGFVDVAPIAVSRGYMRAEIGLVYRDGDAPPLDLADLGGRALALQQGALSGAIAMLQLPPEDRARVVTMNPGAGFLWEVESRGHALAIVDVPAFDAHRQASPFTTLRLADWRHPLGMDIGMAVLAGRTDLRARIDAALAALMATGQVAALAEAAGLTYAEPQTAELMPEMTRATLLQTR